MLALANGKVVLEATVVLPLRGRWTASLRLDAREVVEQGPVVLEAPGMTLRGVARPSRAVVVRDQVYLEAVGGTGGLGAEIAPRSYRHPRVRKILEDLSRDAGETLASSSTSSTLDRTLSGWVRARGTGGAALDELLEALADTPSWRLTDAGELWVGVETWPELVQTGQMVLEEPDTARGRMVLGMPDGALRPGVTFLGRRLTRVTHRLRAGAFRTEVEFHVG
jgi:hypothetical protein